MPRLRLRVEWQPQVSNRPAYRIPSMREIEEIPWNGFNVVSTFSGGGGSSLGYRLAGFRVLWANEFVPAAADTYRANASPGTVVDTRDIREVTGADILNTIGLDVGEIDLLDGSPPCAAFSMCGRREAKWGKVTAYSDTRQRVDDLFFEFTRLLAELRPKTFVAENVAGLARGKAKGYFLRILAAMREAGYRVVCRELDAQWLGVPQRRRRLIFVGVRDDLGVGPAHPRPLPYRYTLRDAIGDLPEAFTDAERDPETGEPLSIRGYSIEPFWRELEPGRHHPKRMTLWRLAWDQPSPTMVARPGKKGTAGLTHPDHPRYFTVRELRRIAGFPNDFQLTGDYRKRVERMGRAVPPPMMARVAETVRDQILSKVGAAG